MKAVIKPIALLLVSALLVGGVFLLDKFNIINIPLFKGQILQLDGKSCSIPQSNQGIAVKPLIGWLKCEFSGATTQLVDIPKGGFFAYLTEWADVPCNYNTETCNYYYMGASATFGWRVCNPTCGTTQSTSNAYSNMKFASLPVGNKVQVTKFGSSSYQVKVEYNVYKLNDYPLSGQPQTINSQSCAVNVDKDFCISSAECPNSLVKSSPLAPGEFVGYLSDWFFSPIETKLVTYQGSQVFCQGTGQLYKPTSHQFESGCYATLGTWLTNVACCPGQETSSQVCNSNFQWENIQATQPGESVQDVQCFSDLQCPGQGQYITLADDIDRGTTVKYTCQSSQCVLTDKVISECASDIACVSGEVCQLDRTTGKGECIFTSSPFQQDQGRQFVCSDDKTVVDDVKACPKGFKMPWALIFASISALLSFLIIGGKGLREKDWVGISIGVISGSAIGTLVYILIFNLMKILAIGIIGTLLGGVLIYFLGGVLIVIATTIALIIKAVRG